MNKYLTIMTNAAIEALLWSSTDTETDEPLDANFYIEDLTAEARTLIQDDCNKFLLLTDHVPHTIDFDQLGHTFMLVRNGHGVSFADQTDCPEAAELLDNLASTFAVVYPLVQDNGEVGIYA